MNAFLKTSPLALACLFRLIAHAENFQFVDDSRAAVCTNGEEIAEWRGRGGVALVPVHAGEAGWRAPLCAQGTVAFGVDATPLALQENMTSLVSRVFVVATATNLQERSTLLFAGTSLWLENGAAGMTLAPALANGSSAAIDGTVGGALAQNCRFLAEITLPAPVRVCDVFIGGHAASPLWRRGWEGAIHEVVMLGVDATGQEAEMVRAFLANYWQIPDAPESPPEAAQALRRLGIATRGFYGSKMILR